MQKAADGDVGDGQQPVEPDAEALIELAAVGFLQLALVRRKTRSSGVVDQVQRKLRPRAVADGVEPADHLNALAIDVGAALLVDVRLEVARQ